MVGDHLTDAFGVGVDGWLFVGVVPDGQLEGVAVERLGDREIAGLVADQRGPGVEREQRLRVLD